MALASAAERLQYRSLNWKRIVPGEQERFMERDAGLRHNARGRSTMRPGRSMDEERMAHENITRTAGGEGRRSAHLYEQALPNTRLSWCRLHVGDAELTTRILSRREGGSW